MNYRKEIINKLIPYFEKDDRFHLLIGDMGFGAVDAMKAKMPDRMTNCGIMEQGMVGIAAGMALSGMIPIVYSIVNFLCFRALEQIRNDVVLQKLNVKFIGTGAEDYFKFLGDSHCCGYDDIHIMDIIKMPVYSPMDREEGIRLTQTAIDGHWIDDAYIYGDKKDFGKVFNEWITSDKAGYIRV